MKIGMLTGVWFIAGGATLAESLRRAVVLGFRHVDLHGVFHGGPAHLTPAERLAIGAEMNALGLVPRNYVLHAPHNIPSASGAKLEENFACLKEGIDMALSWGVNQLMLNAGQWAYGIERRAAWERSAGFLRRICDYAAPRGVFIAQESEPYVWFLVNDTPSTVRMIADVDRPNFTVLVDLGHMALAREAPEELHKIGDQIIHAHFSDHKPFLHTNQEIGTGFTRTKEYIDELRRMDIDGRVKRFGYDELVISLELGAPGDRIDDPDGCVKRSLEHLRQIAPDLTLGDAPL